MYIYLLIRPHKTDGINKLYSYPAQLQINATLQKVVFLFVLCGCIQFDQLEGLPPVCDDLAAVLVHGGGNSCFLEFEGLRF